MHRAVRRRVIAVGARSIHIHSEVVEIVLIGNLVCTERRVVTDAADGRRILCPCILPRQQCCYRQHSREDLVNLVVH